MFKTTIEPGPFVISFVSDRSQMHFDIKKPNLSASAKRYLRPTLAGPPNILEFT